MSVKRWYFAFHPPSGFWGALGHVNAFVATEGAWVFLYPERERLRIITATDDATIDRLFAEQLHAAHVLRYDYPEDLTLPPFGPYTCVAFCGHLVGIRAFTPWGLKRKLLRNGAEPLNAIPSQQPRSDARTGRGSREA